MNKQETFLSENTVSYTQIYEAFAEEARYLASEAQSEGVAISRGWFEAEDGSDIFCQMIVTEVDLQVQVGPVLYPNGDLNTNELITLDSMEAAAREMHYGLTYREVDIIF